MAAMPLVKSAGRSPRGPVEHGVGGVRAQRERGLAAHPQRQVTVLGSSRSSLSRTGSDRGDRFHQQRECVGVVAVRAETPTESGRPCPSDATGTFEPGLPRSTRMGPVSDLLFQPVPRPRRRCPGTRSVPDCQFVEDRVVESAPQRGLGPLSEATVCGLAGTPNEGDRSRQAHPLVST